MIIERKCLTCRLSAENPDLTPDQRLEAARAGDDGRLCLAHPPQVMIWPTQNGPAIVAAYPPVSSKSASCADFEPEFLNG